MEKLTAILAIETSTSLASAALLVGSHSWVRELNGVETHSQGILPALQDLLAQAGLALSDCDAIAFGCGPGAFTGIRTACGIVQGLAFGADLPVVPVGSLLVMAMAAREQNDGTDFVCILDARMNEVYSARYRWLAGAWQEVVAPALLKLEDLVIDQAQACCLVLGQGVPLPAAYADCAHLALMPHARQTALAGLAAHQAGLTLAAELAQPLYLRNKIALTTAERLAQKNAPREG